MIELSVNKFRANLKEFVDKAIDEHQPIRVNRREGKDFVIMSAEDWEREQETFYILQNKSLMRQVADSSVTYRDNNGYKPNQEQLNDIDRI